jgi:hypothetical protein
MIMIDMANATASLMAALAAIPVILVALAAWVRL